ncbi:MAG: M20 family metallopeptidase [Candidatus Bathyarchaeia archaeon]
MDTSIIAETRRKVEEYKSDIISVTSNLIGFPTISPPSETRECAEYIKTYFEEIGLKTTFYEKKKNKTNLHIKVPGKLGKKLLWLGHLDVVPAGMQSEWAYKPFEGVVKNGRVYGRGASDMKGSCAAAMVAAKILNEINENQHATVDFWFTCDEEVGSPVGTRWLVEEGLLKGDACIIGDSLSRVPEEPWIDAGCKGYMRIRLKAKGRTAHGSMPFYGDNAIDKLALAIEKAKQIEDLALNFPKDLDALIESSTSFLLKDEGLKEKQRKAIKKAFHHPTVSLNLISGGVKVNVVPDSAEATFDIRITPGVDPKIVEQKMFTLIESFRDKGVEAETIEVESGYYEKLDTPFAESLREAVKLTTGIQPSSKILLGATDAIPVKKALGIPCLGFGAGIEKLAHAPNEYVSVEGLLIATKVYSILPLIY